MPDVYDRLLGPTVFRPYAVDLGARAAAAGGRRVLELAAGTGLVTAELVARLPDAEVTATDLNAAMVELGRERVPGARWQQADALDLPFEAGQFDLAVCQFGVMFFPDRPAAFREARRVLTDEGTLLFNVWAAIETHDFGDAVESGLARLFPDDPPRFLSSVPHGYADPDAVVADAKAAGFREATIESVTLTGEAVSASAVAEGFCMGTPLRAQIEARGDLAAAVDAAAAEVERRLGAGPGPVAGRMTAYVVTAA
jgi:SAM-dependent methyltransferase